LPEEIISMHLADEDRAGGDSDNFGNDWLDEEGGKEDEDEFSIFNI
jgi:hypothetical protein